MQETSYQILIGFTLVNNNVPIESISQLMGHADIKTTQRYSNKKEQMGKDALDIFLGIVKSD
ncbi:MAG: hypothetical protein COA44_04695 [Arcobacter sp.]|nr:MAG: hypothetical protein COA44_04695 [Arcobacter sp.]